MALRDRVKQKFSRGGRPGQGAGIPAVDDDLGVMWDNSKARPPAERPRTRHAAGSGHRTLTDPEAPGERELEFPRYQHELSDKKFRSSVSESASTLQRYDQLERGEYSARPQTRSATLNGARPLETGNARKPTNAEDAARPAVDTVKRAAPLRMEDFARSEVESREELAGISGLIRQISHAMVTYLERNKDFEWVVLENFEPLLPRLHDSHQLDTRLEVAEQLVNEVIQPVQFAYQRKLESQAELHTTKTQALKQQLFDAQADLAHSPGDDEEIAQTIRQLDFDLSRAKEELKRKDGFYAELLRKSNGKHRDYEALEKKYDDSVTTLQTQLETQRSQHSDSSKTVQTELKSLRTEHNATCKELKSANDKNGVLLDSLRDCQEKYRTLEQNHCQNIERVGGQHKQNLEELALRHRSEIQEQANDHRNETRVIENKLRNAENQLLTLGSSRESDLNNLKSTHEDILQALRGVHSAEQKALEDSYGREIAGLKQASKKALTDVELELDAMVAAARDEKYKLEAAHKKALSDLRQSHTDEIRRTRQKHEEEESFLRKQLEDTENDAVKEVDRLKSLHDQELKSEKDIRDAQKEQLLQKQRTLVRDFTQKNKNDTLQLRKQVQELNNALENLDGEMYVGKLFTTSGLPRKPDDELKKAFMSINTVIAEELGRLEWISGRNVLTDELLRRLHGEQSQRLLKKAILQDLIWTLLYGYVFASPFRVLGEEGRELEQEWVEHCGRELNDSGLAWPTPGARAERWRYFTVDQCHEALKTPMSNRDPRARIKKGYKDNLTALMKHLQTSLEGIIDFTPDVAAQIKSLCTQAAKIWLDFQMHRCRIVLCLAGTHVTSTEDRIAQISRGAVVELTVSPELGRHGNMKGLDLDHFTVIGGCELDSFKVGSSSA